VGKGALICFEGLDGSGKETQSNLLVDYIKTKGRKAIRFEEPSPLPVGRLIEKCLTEKISLEKETFALLFAADRMEDTVRNIKPKLEEGYVVVCDRYVLSSLAYQTAMGLDLAWVKELNRHAISPDLVLFLDINPEKSLKRIREKELFDKLEFQKKVRARYLNLIGEYKHRIIDGSKPKEKVHEEVLNAIAGIID
jgi:dTMP kinase